MAEPSQTIDFLHALQIVWIPMIILFGSSIATYIKIWKDNKRTEEILDTKFKAAAEIIEVKHEQHKIEINDSLNALRKESIEADNKLKEEFESIIKIISDELKRYNAHFTTLCKTQTMISKIENDYEQLVCHANDPMLREIMTHGTSAAMEFIKEIFAIGIENVEYDAVCYKIDVKSKAGRVNVKRVNPELAKNWHQAHGKFAEKLKVDLKPVFDKSDPAYKYNNKVTGFTTAIRSFVQHALTGMLIAWEKTKQADKEVSSGKH